MTDCVERLLRQHKDMWNIAPQGLFTKIKDNESDEFLLGLLIGLYPSIRSYIKDGSHPDKKFLNDYTRFFYDARFLFVRRYREEWDKETGLDKPLPKDVQELLEKALRDVDGD